MLIVPDECFTWFEYYPNVASHYSSRTLLAFLALLQVMTFCAGMAAEDHQNILGVSRLTTMDGDFVLPLRLALLTIINNLECLKTLKPLLLLLWCGQL